jgi:hypothetical protein
VRPNRKIGDGALGEDFDRRQESALNDVTGRVSPTIVAGASCSLASAMNLAARRRRPGFARRKHSTVTRTPSSYYASGTTLPIPRRTH